MAIHLSKRLTALANMVTDGNRLADIGTDHGYIPIYLCQTGKIPSALAMDIGKGPLQQAQTHIAEHGLSEQIKTRLSDGMAALQFGEADTILIAGMGGGLVMKILSEGAEKLTGKEELILQPQSEIALVREFLRVRNFQILNEDMILEDGKYYPILRAVPGEKENLKAEELFYGPRLLENQNPVLLEYLQKQQNQNRMLIGQLSGNPGEKATQRLCELKEKEAILESALARFHTM